MQVSALIGNPTDHSVSPTLFDIYADEHGLEYSHIKLNIEKSDLETVIKTIPAFGFIGVNITLPYKMDVIPHLDSVSPEISKIGAVNTIVNDRGKLVGYNTDRYGAVRTIEENLGRELDRPDRAAVFGSGGAARAIVSGLLDKNVRVTVVCRTPESEKTKAFKHDFEGLVEFKTYDSDLDKLIDQCQVVCNATPLGMAPSRNTTPLSESTLKKVSASSLKGKVFFDAVFNPAKTLFLSYAEKYGSITASGIDMMVYQGVQAFYLWTGKQVSSDAVKKARDVLRSIL